MELLESSHSWIVALGKTVLNSLWLGLLFLSLVKTFFALIPPRLAVYRYRVALVSLFIFTLLIAGFFLRAFTPAESPEGSVTAGLPLLDSLLTYRELDISWAGIFYRGTSLVYIAGIGINLLLILRAGGKIRSLRRSSATISGFWHLRFIDLKKRAGVRKPVELLLGEQVVTPFLTGVLKPAIIVPSAMLSQLSFQEIEAILMHELFHIKRFDHAFNLIQKTIDILFFFNPAVRIISNMIREEREKCCDDLVLACHSAPLQYARALYSLSQHYPQEVSVVSAATGRGNGALKNRIERILKPETMKTNFREKVNALILMSLGILIVLVISGFSSGFSITRHNYNLADKTPSSPVNSDNASIITKPAIEKEIIAVIPPDTLNREEQMKIKREIESAIEDIDWDQITDQMEEAKKMALEDIDWDRIRDQMEEAKKMALEDIDWDQIKEDMKNVGVHVDSLMKNFELDKDFDFDFDFDFDMEMEEHKDSKEEI